MTATPTRHVAKDGTVTWRVRFRYGVNKAGTGRRQASETFATQKEAERFALLLKALGPQGAIEEMFTGDQKSDAPTLDQLAAAHIEHLPGIEAGTRKTYTRLWDRTWHPLLGHIRANELTRDDVSRAVNVLGDRYSRKSLENQRGLLSAVVGRAVDDGYLTKNHAKGIRLPRGQEAERTEMRILTPTEFAVVVDRAPDHWRPLLRFLAGTGCRWGEAVALQIGDLDLQHRGPDGRAQPLVYFRRALKWSPDGARTVGPTKTKKSKRTIVLPPELLTDMAELVADRPRTDLVFTAKRGGAVLHRTFWSRVWLPAVGDRKCPEHADEKAPAPKCADCQVGLVPRPRIHDLRHSHASWLLGQGVPIHVVQARLGHESIQTTVDTYSHLLPDAQQMAASAASLAFSARKPIGA